MLLFIFCCLLSECVFLGRAELPESFMGFPEFGCQKTQVGISALLQNFIFFSSISCFGINFTTGFLWVLMFSSSFVNCSCFVAVWVLVWSIDSFCLFMLLTWFCMRWWTVFYAVLFCFQLFLMMCYWEGCSAMKFICGAVTWIG